MGRGVDLQYGQQITIVVGSDRVSGRVEEYAVRIDKVEPNRIWVTAPVTLPRRAQVRLVVSQFDGDRVSGSRFVADVPVVAHDRAIPGRVALKLPKEWARIQEREFVRVNVGLPVKLRRLTEGGAPDSPWLFGETVNLSGGGLSLRNVAGIAVAARRVQLQLYMQNDTIAAEAEVIRANAGENDQRHEKVGDGVVAFRFTKIREMDRDRIVKYIFELQADMRRKGLA